MSGLAKGNCGDVPGLPPCWQSTNAGSFDVALSLGAAGCPADPLPGCVSAGKASLTVNEAANGKEKLKLAMKALGQATTAADFGDPVAGGTGQRVCVYDSADALVGELLVDRAGQTCGAKPCWKALGSVGFRYRDPSASASGMSTFVQRAGPAGKGKLVAKARNNAAKGQTSMPTGIAAALAGATAARAQLQTSDAGCFDAALGTVKRADGVVFRAVAP